ncbi:MAG: IgGFc-binding protein [Kofleriaceae bacterium]|jgi:hypothetical protein|nr:IgGFc-binding protein [Kofleriaceae bacterium]
MTPNLLPLAALVTLTATAACGPGPRGNGDAGPASCNLCTALGWQECLPDGSYADPIACPEGQVCVAELGCAVCEPGAAYCDGPSGNDIFECNADGTGGVQTGSCVGDEVCSDGTCKTPCQAAADTPSNVGCDFWAADLDNEQFNSIFGGFGSNDAAGAQYAVVIANNNDSAVGVRVTRNAARVGQPTQEADVVTVTVPARSAQRIDLPQRELDGTMGQNAGYAPGTGSGTFVSPHAYHIVTTLPVVAYQFNPIVQDFSNDASTLIPRQALGNHYLVFGWPTANPCGQPQGQFGYQPSIPDHTAITVVAVEDGTTVTVNPTHPITASGGDSGLAIARTDRGQPLVLTLNKYDVANLESDQPRADILGCISAAMQNTGDFTGSVVSADKPVVVFTSHERAIGFGGANPAPQPSPNWTMQDGICCTDHFEEQLLPTTAHGRQYAVARSPIRSTDPGWKEPDIYRVVASKDGTTVTTSLPAPNASFTLDAGAYRTFPASAGFTLSADKGVMLGQVLVSQHFIPDGFIGDPSLILLPAAEQYRASYVFLVPSTFRDNYMVLAKPTSAALTYDGMPLTSEGDCVTAPIGDVLGIGYEQVTCRITEGRHEVASSVPFGLFVYGYYNVGSYAFAGGSDVKIINPIE